MEPAHHLLPAQCEAEVWFRLKLIWWALLEQPVPWGLCFHFVRIHVHVLFQRPKSAISSVLKGAHAHTIRVHYNQLVFHRTPKWNSPVYWWKISHLKRRPGIDNTISECICTQCIQISRESDLQRGSERKRWREGEVCAGCINLGFINIQ